VVQVGVCQKPNPQNYLDTTCCFSLAVRASDPG
jgi:hypothetical protein